MCICEHINISLFIFRDLNWKWVMFFLFEFYVWGKVSNRKSVELLLERILWINIFNSDKLSSNKNFINISANKEKNQSEISHMSWMATKIKLGKIAKNEEKRLKDSLIKLFYLFMLLICEERLYIRRTRNKNVNT